jgi:hypothetical protein
MTHRTRHLSLGSSAALGRLALTSVLLVGAALAWSAVHAQAAPGGAAQEAQPQSAADSTGKMRLSPAQVQQAFRYIDRDSNGSLSRNEIAVFPRIEKHFERIDADHDGAVSPAEFEVAVQQAS